MNVHSEIRWTPGQRLDIMVWFDVRENPMARDRRRHQRRRADRRVEWQALIGALTALVVALTALVIQCTQRGG